ncbi:hypothetical protein F2Q70_00017769 [Brassica cretica]|uniref:Uncharacterized protein n=1 Tax=Brassica cretica TaxID=69181 RepID=A0A8S9I066_BRACR|nr:hypothetical protein F2Q70_00017769 [Brassica cretica]
MIVWIAGAVIRLYVGKGELPRHLDQGDLIRERSIGVGIGVRFSDSSWLGFSALWTPVAWSARQASPSSSGLLRRARGSPQLLFELCLARLLSFVYHRVAVGALLLLE